MEDGKERCPSEEDDGLGTRRESDGFDTPIRLSAPPPTSEGFNFEGVQEARGQEDGEGRETPNQQPQEEPVATTREAGDLARSAPTKVSRPPWNDADVDSPCRSSQTRRRDQVSTSAGQRRPSTGRRRRSDWFPCVGRALCRRREARRPLTPCDGRDGGSSFTRGVNL